MKIGIVGRFFPINYRDALTEIGLIKNNKFDAIQFPGKEYGLTEDFLGNKFEDISKLLIENHIIPTMEIVVKVDGKGRTKSEQSLDEILKNNLNSIQALKIEFVHIHISPINKDDVKYSDLTNLERSFTEQFKKCLEIAKKNKFNFGFEHNEPELKIFSTPQSCKHVIENVEGIKFVWDSNHTEPDLIDEYIELLEYSDVIHISDTHLPELNFHLPIGKGNFDFKSIFNKLKNKGFDGVIILEIGGLPKSGGYGKATDDALKSSKSVIKDLLAIP